jgi:murein DD-endopeptidase MepM/ murein hydrolase activator NlpD
LLHVRRILILVALVACAAPLADGPHGAPARVASIDEPRAAPIATEPAAHSAGEWFDAAVGWLLALPPPVPDVSVLVRAPLETDEPSDFGWRSDPFRHTPKFHSGADFRAKPGTPIAAAGDGVVSFAGWYFGYGRMVWIDHGNGVVTRYAHMRRIVAQKDQHVTAGTTIGEVGQSGHATGPHLHFEVLLDGRFVDPITAMTVGEIVRESPARGRLAAYALVPELQPSPNDPAKVPSRPERKVRGKRPQVLW